MKKNKLELILYLLITTIALNSCSRSTDDCFTNAWKADGFRVDENWDSAIYYYNRAIDFDRPNRFKWFNNHNEYLSHYYYKRSQCNSELGSFKEASKDADSALIIENENKGDLVGRICLQKSLCLLKLGEKDESIIYLYQALQSDENLRKEMGESLYRKVETQILEQMIRNR